MTTALTAHAQGSDETRSKAKALFERGVADYAAGQYASALGNFQEAFRLRPHPLVNVNIANCYDKLGKSLQALFHFQRFLESAAGTTAQREEVGAAIERLKQQIGKVLLRITPDGALAIIDRGDQRKAPVFEAVQLEAGQHSLEVRLEGYQSVQRTLTVRGGSTLELNIALEPEQPAPLPTPAAALPAPIAPVEPTLRITPAAENPPVMAVASPPAESVPTAAPQETAPARSARAPGTTGSESGLPTRVWIAGGVSLVLAAAGTVTGLLALNANSDFEAARSARYDVTNSGLERLASYNDARDAASRASALALTTDLLLGGALIGAATTVFFIATRTEERKPATAQLSPLVTRQVAGLQLRAAL